MSGAVAWLTGLPGSGKTTISTIVAERLRSAGRRVEHLDGDVLRAQFGVTGFERPDREAYLARVGALAAGLEAEGAVVVAALVSPYRASRDAIRARCTRFVEVYVATPLHECERRDPKGMYARARRGEILHFTGVDDPYEPPPCPELTIDTLTMAPDEAAELILDRLGDATPS